MTTKQSPEKGGVLFLTDQTLREFCKIGQYDKCCRYLASGQSGFVCAKLEPSLKEAIDERKDTFIAQGDNCKGILMLNATSISRN